MVDISKCTNEECPLKMKCYRYTAIASTWQTYSVYEVPKNRKKCDSFWGNKGRRNRFDKPEKKNKEK